MAVLEGRNLCLRYGPRVIFDNVNFQLQSGDKVALCGDNGSGKSTLLDVIIGDEKADSGQITLSKGSKISYLRQNSSNLIGSNSLKDELLNSDFQDSLPEYEKMKRIDELYRNFGFQKSDIEKRCNEFSQGWQMRIALIKTLISGSDFLLLDEPVNYLDIETRLYLLKVLASIKSSFILICHDKYFLDKSVSYVYDLFNCKITKYRGNYSSFESERISRDRDRKKREELIEKKKEHLEEFVDRFRYKATKAKQAQQAIKRLEKLNDGVVYEEVSALKKVRFVFPYTLPSPQVLIEIENLYKSYDGINNIISDLSLTVSKYDRLAVIGRNARGKSTLLNLMCKKILPTSGYVKMPSGVRIGFFDQNIDRTLNFDNTIYNEISSSSQITDESKLKSLIGSFGFSQDDSKKKIAVLSGGERTRLGILKMLCQPTNLLILDEITNNLDIKSKDILLNALKEYKGTIVFVSHDIDFVEKLATKILYLSKDSHQYFNGDFSYFLYKASNSTQGSSQSLFLQFGEKLQKKDLKKDAEDIDKVRNVVKDLSSYELRKKVRNDTNSIKRKIKALEDDIEITTNEIQSLEEKLNDPAYYSDVHKCLKITEDLKLKKDKLKALEEMWLSVSESIDNN